MSSSKRMDIQQLFNNVVRRWKPFILLIPFLIVIGYSMYIWIYLPKSHILTPMFLLSKSERERLCSQREMAGDKYDILEEGRHFATPETNITLLDQFDLEGEPSGYIVFLGLNEPRCYSARFYWLEQGVSVDTVFIPITEKIGSNTAIRKIEYFQRISNVKDYGKQMHMDEEYLETLYEEWVDFESIIYP